MKIYKNGITQDSETGQIYQVGKSADAVDATPVSTPTTPTPVTPATTPISDVYGNPSYETPEEKAFRESQALANKTTATTPIDENAIRTSTLSKFQSEIDALNRVYAEKKAAEKIAGEGRMGTVAAVGARRGLLGSDFGIAQENIQTNANTEAINAIENERLAKESAILAQARAYGDSEIAKKEAARKSSSEDYLKYISGQTESRKQAAANFAKNIYSAGLGDTTDFDAVAKSIGVSVETLNNVYKEYKKEQDAVKAETLKKETKAQQDAKDALAKDGYTYINTPAERDAAKAKGYQIVEINGRTYSKVPKTTTKDIKIGSTTYQVTTDEMGNIIKKNIIGTGGGSGSGSKSSSDKFNIQDATASMSRAIDAQKGPEGYLAKEDWATLMSQWLQAGGTAKTFSDNFKQYTNPSDTYKYIGV